MPARVPPKAGPMLKGSNMYRGVILILLTMLSGGPGAFAQDTSDVIDDTAFRAFLASDYMQRIRREAVQRSMVLHQPECFEAPALDLQETGLLSPMIFTQGAQVPNQGIWRERVEVLACEETSVENIVHAFTDEGQSSYLLARGRTRSDVNTQIELIGEVVEAAMADDAAEGCDIGRISDTYVSEVHNDARWLERWEVRACGSRIDVDIMFTTSRNDETTYELSVLD